MVMICIFCQTEHERLTSNNCCAPCQDWILSDRFGHVFNYFPDGNKTVAVLYYSIIAINDYKLSIYFDFNKNRILVRLYFGSICFPQNKSIKIICSNFNKELIGNVPFVF